MFSGIPAQDADTIAAAQAELLAAERLQDLCKQLGLAIPKELQSYQKPEAPEYPPHPPSLRFPLQQEKQKQQLKAQQEQQLAAQQEKRPEQEDVKPDIKPPRRLATSYLGKPGLLHMLGTRDKDHIITRVVPGTAPLQEYKEDNLADVITIDYEMEDSDVDDLSGVSMTSVDGISKEELQELLANIAASHKKVAESIDALAARVKDMSVDQAEEAAVAITTEMGHIRGLSEITQAFDQVEIGLILATGIRKMHEYQCLKGKREEADRSSPIVSWRRNSM